MLEGFTQFNLIEFKCLKKMKALARSVKIFKIILSHLRENIFKFILLPNKNFSLVF